MNAQNRNVGWDRPRRRNVPRLERLEPRDLPTVLVGPDAVVPKTPAAMPDPSPAQIKALAASTGSGGGTTTPTVAPGNGEMIGEPTPHEVLRQLFVARFKGKYVIGSGRFTGTAEALSSLGYGGGNQALHWLSNMRIVVPTDPTQPITGTIYMNGRNIANTGNSLVLALQGDPTTAVNGFPTHYTWNVDPASGGIYSSANGYATGHGTLDIRFFPAQPGPVPGSRSGQLQYSIIGFINASGITNDLGVLGNISHNTPPRVNLGRLHRT
jgi:hypothetical protein